MSFDDHEPFMPLTAPCLATSSSAQRPSSVEPLRRVGRSCLGDVLVLGRAPQPLDKPAVHPAPTVVHRDAHAGRTNGPVKAAAVDRSPVGIEDARLAEAHHRLLPYRPRTSRAKTSLGKGPDHCGRIDGARATCRVSTRESAVILVSGWGLVCFVGAERSTES